ncbi:hypothetical protein BU16DRAFT_469797 [Lophium mytilinum]|uniref:Uncharacterized protein n=1 Tax=Lophium mytilinum TaxID=390894 RepID=A0A6A6QFC4_9PEZI|nr:hypothetical protein BU16DRAFT_469797 [Lophium mytilinum]
MGGNAEIVDGYGYLTVQRALDIARNSEGGVDPVISSFLEKAILDLWARLHAQPNTYILSKDEFALFNYFRARFQSSDIAQRAVKRFWDHYEGDPNSVDLSD